MSLFSGSRRGPLVGASGVVGFGAYPSYVLAEAGYGADHSIVNGGAVLVGFATRVEPRPSVGPAVRFGVDVLFLHVGVRAIGIVTNGPEFQLTGLLGLGRF